MDIFSNLLLAIVQGLTEFLPVSSSGHIEIVKVLLGVNLEGSQALWYTTVLHIGTAISTIVVFRKSLLEFILGVFSKKPKALQYLGMLMVSLIPAGIVGLVFEKEIESLFTGNLILIGIALMFTGGMLFIANRPITPWHNTPSWKTAIIMGIFQAIAILPGVSRSGATIASGLQTGVKKEEISKFSFLMVLPLIFGKIFLDLIKIYQNPQQITYDISYSTILLGLGVSFLVGLIACKWMISLVNAQKLSFFAIYCLVIGALVFGYSFL